MAMTIQSCQQQSVLSVLWWLLSVSPDDFYYTSHGMAPEIDGVDDAEDMLSARDALTMLGKVTSPEKDCKCIIFSMNNIIGRNWLTVS